MRVILANATHAQVLAALMQNGTADKEAVRMTCHAIAHGFYRGRRVYLDYDYAAEDFLLVIKR